MASGKANGVEVNHPLPYTVLKIGGFGGLLGGGTQTGQCPFRRHGWLHGLLRTVERGSRLYTYAKLVEAHGRAVREQGGVVQSFTGDGIMAVFGAPVAFEDAPVRACRAALSILDRLKAAAPDLRATHGVQRQLRIGLNTGQAVVGKVQGGADAGVTVLGDTVNFAACLQSLAEPDSVL